MGEAKPNRSLVFVTAILVVVCIGAIAAAVYFARARDRAKQAAQQQVAVPAPEKPADTQARLAAEDKVAALEKQLAEAVKRVAAAEERLTAERQSSDPLRATVGELRLAKEKTEGEKTEALKAAAEVQKNLEKAKSDLVKAATDLAKAQAELSKAKSDLADAERKQGLAEGRLKTSLAQQKLIEADLNVAKDKIAVLEGEIEQLKQKPAPEPAPTTTIP